MGLTHIRTPKNFVLEERIERYAAAIERHPESLAGRWAEACFPGIGASATGAIDTSAARSVEVDRAVSSASPAVLPRFARVHLDLGCGKGTFIVKSAQADPQTLFIGMDIEPICVAYAAQAICEQDIGNAVLVPRGAQALGRIFAPSELDAITLNFPTPHPRAHDATRRLTSVDHLLAYRRVLAQEATVTLRTDSQPLRDFSLTQFQAAGYRVLWSSDDVRAEHPHVPVTEYEQRLAERGAMVHGICATPGPEPSAASIAAGRAAEQSLMRYLPDDLDSLAYVPLGMEAAVTNFRNRRRRERERRA